MKPLAQDETLRKAFEDTARHLAGKAVIVRFVPPPSEGATGECYKSGGVLHIDIDPRCNPQKVYQIALHEIAHLKLHHGGMVELGQGYATSPQAIPLTDETPADVEREARQLADHWERWAHQQVTKILRSARYDTTTKALAAMTALKFYE